VKYTFLISSLFFSPLALAGIDYSKCTASFGFFGPVLNDQGAIVKGPLGYVLKNKSTEGKVET
jgi:hypothetical protein